MSVLVIAGSVRANRVGLRIAQFVADIAKKAAPDADYELVDLREWKLPLDDEPYMPGTGKYTQPHTLRWAAKVKSAAGVIFVAPEYNAGYSAALKNAVDHVLHEWENKPAALVTYGGRFSAGGSRSNESFRAVMAAVKMRVAASHPALVLPKGAYGVPSEVQASDFAEYEAAIATAAAELSELRAASAASAAA